MAHDKLVAIGDVARSAPRTGRWRRPVRRIGPATPRASAVGDRAGLVVQWDFGDGRMIDGVKAVLFRAGCRDHGSRW